MFWLITKLGYRNILRNKRRTVISVLAIALCLAALIVSDAFILGMNRNMVKNITGTFAGDGAIYQKLFRQTLEVEKTVNNYKQIKQALEKEPLILAFSSRTLTNAIVASPYDIANISLFGIDVQREAKISKIKQAIIRGDNLSNSGQILIGEKLAKKLGVDLNDKIVITVAQSESGEILQELFNVKAVFSFGDRHMDNEMAFVDLKQSQQMLAIGDNVHEIALKFKNNIDVLKVPQSFWQRYENNNNEILSWKELSPQISAIVDMSYIFTTILLIILFALIAVIIMNNLFMSLYDRMYEFGVLRSVGTRSSLLIKIIIMEGLMLALLSIIIGIILALIFGGYLAVYGINYQGLEIGSLTLNEPIYAIFKFYQFSVYPLAIIIFVLLSSLYPAFHAAGITLIKALRHKI